MCSVFVVVEGFWMGGAVEAQGWRRADKFPGGLSCTPRIGGAGRDGRDTSFSQI